MHLAHAVQHLELIELPSCRRQHMVGKKMHVASTYDTAVYSGPRAALMDCRPPGITAQCCAAGALRPAVN